VKKVIRLLKVPNASLSTFSGAAVSCGVKKEEMSILYGASLSTSGGNCCKNVTVWETSGLMRETARVIRLEKIKSKIINAERDRGTLLFSRKLTSGLIATVSRKETKSKIRIPKICWKKTKLKMTLTPRR
jgi:hypothetical protein